MDCPNCGIQLTHLAEVLAQTETGTNCPRCWARVRRLAPPPAQVKVFKAPENVRRARRGGPLRRAA